MVIDEILERCSDVEKGIDDWTYDKAKRLYDAAEQEGEFDITYMLDYGDEKDLKAALCRFIDEKGEDPEIKEFINAVNWTTEI